VTAIGIYGVTAFAVSRRTSEIGVRMALGASRAGILREMVSRNVGLAAIGIAGGIAAALPLVRQAGTLLYDVEPRDPATFLVAGLVFAAVAVVASLVPARRAARLDPVTALRAE
jgi:ABC-type antimicrobial peptide transport system permease subunit